MLDVDGQKKEASRVGPTQEHKTKGWKWSGKKGPRSLRKMPPNNFRVSTAVQELRGAPDSLPARGSWRGISRSCLEPSNPYAEPCEKRLTFHSKCVTHRTGHFQGHLAIEPGAGWSLWPCGVTCRSDVNRWEQQSAGQESLLIGLGLRIAFKTGWSEIPSSLFPTIWM